MAGHLLSVALGLLGLAATAAGMLTPENAPVLWALAVLFLAASFLAWVWEHRRAASGLPSASTAGNQSPAIVGDRNSVTYAPLRPDQSALDDAIGQRLREADALRERLHGSSTHTTISVLLADTRDWQDRCVGSVRRAAPDRVDVFKARAGTYQPLMGQPGWYGQRGNWRRPYEERLERWMLALTELHA